MKSDAELDLKCFGEDVVQLLAKDVGISVADLHALASRGPESADLLLHRMRALDLDRNEVPLITPETFRDLQKLCTMCESHERCGRDLTRDTADPKWKDYCPNAATLLVLNSLPWVSRSEW